MKNWNTLQSYNIAKDITADLDTKLIQIKNGGSRGELSR